MSKRLLSCYQTSNDYEIHSVLREAFAYYQKQISFGRKINSTGAPTISQVLFLNGSLLRLRPMMVVFENYSLYYTLYVASEGYQSLHL